MDAVRKEFPALSNCQDWVFGDAPTGTQCHFSVSEGFLSFKKKLFFFHCHFSVFVAMHDYLNRPGAHLMGRYPGAINTISTTTKARMAAAAFFNCKPEEV